MGIDSVFQAFSRAFSGPRAKSFNKDLYAFNRKITHPEYQKGARFCRGLMKQLGFGRVELLQFPIDGKRLYGNWKTPRYWDVREAWLKLKINGRWQTFADYKKVPTSVFVYAAPTRGEVSTQLVDMGSSRLRGKLVFCDPADQDRLDLDRKHLAQKGALGMATDFSPNWKGVRSDRDFRDGHRWDNATLAEDRHGLAGFSLSRNQGRIIRRELKKHGAVECRYKIRGRLGPGPLSCVTGCIRGASRPNEEVVVPAHLYEAGANDNASGVAATIEALNAINTLVHKGALPRPARTIRAVFTFEIVGFLAYFNRIKKLKKTYVAGVNPDMVGEDQKKCRSTLNVYASPDSNATFADPLLFRMVRKYLSGKLRYRFKKYIVNDNIISDPAIGVPCPALIHLRDRFYHSNQDSMDKVSPKTLHAVGSVMAAYLYLAASVDRDSAGEMARVCVLHAKRRIRKAEKTGLTRARLDHIVECEKTRLSGLAGLTQTNLDKPMAAIERLKDKVSLKKTRVKRFPRALVKKAMRIVPKRTCIGPLTFEHIPPEKRERLKFQPAWSGKFNLPLYWADGRRNLWEIFQKAECESGPYNLREFLDYFKLLKKEKLVRF
jgi:aminopeptidase-like protein